MCGYAGFEGTNVRLAVNGGRACPSEGAAACCATPARRSTPEATGLEVYAELLDVKKAKPVYVLASHSHFVMEGIFDTPYWREHGGVLPGWIIGTSGAFRYALPTSASQAKFAKTLVYGYLLGTVSPHGAGTEDPIRFEFQEVTEGVTSRDVIERYGSDLVHRCYQENAQGAP